jgi:hypothetical protein
VKHAIHRVKEFQKIGPFTLRVHFDDGTDQAIDFRPVLIGDQVRLDDEAHTLIWPNGADFDPAMLHDWPVAGRELVALAQSWAAVHR